MKIFVSKPVEIDVKYLHLSVPVRYEEEDIPNDFPFREADTWTVTIDIEKGQINNWPKNAFEFTYKLHMKVCDEGTYELQDGNFQRLSIREEGYVPDILPGENYGDYIILDIEPDGKITNWKKVTEEKLHQFFPGDD